MKKYLLLLSLTFFSGCATHPLAFSPASIRPQSAQQLSARSYAGVKQAVVQLRKLRFQEWDLNRDGVLTRNEVTDNNLTIPDLVSGFHDYDQNQDNQITLPEFLKENVIHWWMDQYRMVTDGEFDLIDDDDNGIIEGPELQETQVMFARWPELKGGDIDGDGKVNYSEFEDTYMQVYQHIPR